MKNTLLNDNIEKYTTNDWKADLMVIGIITILTLAVVAIVAEFAGVWDVIE